MRIIARNTLTRYLRNLTGHKDHRALKAALDAWFHEAKQAEWKNSAEVKERYRDYRLVTAIDYRRGIVFIKWLGTHKDYDKIDARTVQYDD